MKVQQVLAATLVEHGTDVVFGLIGDANLFFVHRYVETYGRRYVKVAHEATAVSMAAGYAATTGEVGVATVTHGPGLTNTLTALTEAVRMRYPMVLIAGDTPTVASTHLQDIDQRAVIAPTGAGFRQVRSPETASEDLAAAFHQARTERRPVVLDVPADFQWVEVGDEVAAPRVVQDPIGVPSQLALDAALGLAASANRPVVLAGGGAVHADAPRAVHDLAVALGAPIVTSLRAKDLLGGDARTLGIVGSLGTPAASAALAASDCVVAFGASLNVHTTQQGGLLEDTRVVQCDRDPAAFGAHTAVDVALLGDVAATADAMVELLTEAEITPSDWSWANLPVPDLPAGAGRSATDDSFFGTAMARIDACVPDARTVVSDAGRFAYHVPTLLRVPDPTRWVYAWGGFGAIGLGMGTALGAAVGNPDDVTVHVTGDGGFMLGGLLEFGTACREDLDLIVVVCNDDAYGAEHIQFTDRGLVPEISVNGWPDLAPVAEALGGRGLTVRCERDLDAVVEAVRDRDRPLLIDLKLDPASVPRPY